jgi:chorismate dehydratase
VTRVHLGAVGYLNARPHVCGLDRFPRFGLRFDMPSRCADLLHAGAIDVGLIPSIEYLNGPAGTGPRTTYRIVPDVAIASRGAVASVALYTKRPMSDVQSIALDTSSRTSVALARVLCAREFKIQPRLEARGPDLGAMLEECDAALIIGDAALFLDHERLGREAVGASVEKIDLGALWTARTGLPFVYAFWAGRPSALTPDDVRTLQRARDAGVANITTVAREYFADAERQAIGARYLRDNIKYHLGPDEQAGLDLFFRYALEAGVVSSTRALEFYDA